MAIWPGGPRALLNRLYSGRSDRGITLVETMITMVVLTLFLSAFATAFLNLSKAVRKQTGVVDAQTSVRSAFLLLDKQIRYANAVTTPTTVNGDQWIEWRVEDPSIPVATSASQSRCYQWRASATSGALQMRTWVVPTTGAVSTPTWRSVASGLVIGSQPVFTISSAGLRAAPFSLPSPGSQDTLNRSQVGVSVTVSKNNPAGRASMSTVFTAVNSSAAPVATCTEVARS